MKDITVGVVTYNSPELVEQMLWSLREHSGFEGTVVLVNNGGGLPSGVLECLRKEDVLLEAGQNLRWEGGVNAALGECGTEWFCMANDDLFFPPDERFWHKLARWLEAGAGGVAPSSNYVSGAQNVWLRGAGARALSAPYLIGMLAMYPTKLLRELGGLDTGLPGGDDVDLSIRVRARGLKLVAERRSYVHHVGSATGRREHGDAWDSRAHQMATVNALVRKHGLAAWYAAWCGVAHPVEEISR